MAQPGWFSQRNKMHVMGMWWGDDGHVVHSFLKINHFDSFWYTLGILGLFRAGGCSSISILAGVFAARLKSCEVDITDYRVLAVENKENISRVLQVVSSPDPWLVTEYIQISSNIQICYLNPFAFRCVLIQTPWSGQGWHQLLRSGTARKTDGELSSIVVKQSRQLMFLSFDDVQSLRMS